LQPQDRELTGFQLEHEIGRKSGPIAVHLLIEAFNRNSIDLREGRIEDDFLMGQNRNAGFDGDYGRPFTFWQRLLFLNGLSWTLSDCVIVGVAALVWL
jgi:hypothetical protein